MQYLKTNTLEMYIKLTSLNGNCIANAGSGRWMFTKHKL